MSVWVPGSGQLDNELTDSNATCNTAEKGREGGLLLVPFRAGEKKHNSLYRLLPNIGESKDPSMFKDYY